MLRSFDPAVAGGDVLDQGIEDPWYGGHMDFELTWNLIQAAVPGIVKHVRAYLAPQGTGQGQRAEQRVRSIS
jgi:protein-tyrosine phosphatase